MIGEIGDRLVGGFEEAERLRLERELHGAAGRGLERDEMRDDAQYVLGIARHHVAAGDPRLEAQAARSGSTARSGGQTSASTSATLMVYCVRSSERQSGS
jgi:hypothetical protein